MNTFSGLLIHGLILFSSFHMLDDICPNVRDGYYRQLTWSYRVILVGSGSLVQVSNKLLKNSLLSLKNLESVTI